MTAGDLMRAAFRWGPVFFGIGFVAPLVAQSLEAMSVPAPLGMSTLHFGLGVGLVLGSVAKLRGRWI